MWCWSNLVLLVGILACVGVEGELASLKPTSQATCVGQSRLFQLTPAIGRMGASILRDEMQPLSSIIRVFEVDGEMTKTLVHLPVDRVWHPLTVRFRLLIRKTQVRRGRTASDRRSRAARQNAIALASVPRTRRASIPRRAGPATQAPLRRQNRRHRRQFLCESSQSETRRPLRTTAARPLPRPQGRASELDLASSNQQEAQCLPTRRARISLCARTGRPP